VEGKAVRESDRRRLFELRQALVPLHRTLLEWERVAYERLHGRTEPGALLGAIVSDPQFAWLRPMSELIVHIDTLLDTDRPEVAADVTAILARAGALVAPDEAGAPYAQRYHAALQEAPDVVFAHRRVTAVLQGTGPRDTIH
jgi:hypothetical protein